MKLKSSCHNVVIVTVLLSMLLAGAGFAADAAELKDPSGDKPFFETWDEDMGYCSMVVAMDGTVLLFEPVRFEDKPGYTIVKRSEDGGKTGETVDLNGRNKGITIERAIGERPNEIIDYGNSHATVGEVVSIGEPQKLTAEGVGTGYGRFTRKPFGRTVSLDIKQKTILADATNAALRVETPKLPDALPRFTVKATVEVTMKDGSKKEYSKEVEIDVRDVGVKPEKKSWKQDTVLVSPQGAQTVVRPLEGDKILFKNADPQLAIEWAMANARTTVVLAGKYVISDSIGVPRDDVTLIIGPGAEISLNPQTEHKTDFGFRPAGSWHNLPLIYNHGHDNVRVIHLGTLVHSIWRDRKPLKQTFPIVFDGRNNKRTCGIEGAWFS